MFSKNIKCLLVIAIGYFQLLTPAIASNGYYSIIGPGTLHPKHKYSIAAGVYDVSEPVEINVGIVGPNFDNRKTIELMPHELQSIEFDLPDLPELEDDATHYNLTVEGLKGLIFKNTTKLNYRRFHPTVKIQTDKGKYKPGDLLNFRIIFLDENLTPAELPEGAYIWIEDAKGNRLKEFKNIKLVKGVYTSNYQLSEYAALGYWYILVHNGEKYNPRASFTVEKYVLPKYAVSVEATERVSVRDGDMLVVVRANYTYGKPVNAKTTLIITMSNYYYSSDDSDKKKKDPPILLHVVDMVNGKAKFDINIKEYADYMPSNSTSYTAKIQATVEEHFTGVQINGSAYSSFYPYRYSIDCATWNECHQFEASKEQEIALKVTYVDNSKVDDAKSIVRLIFTEELRKYDFYNSNGEKEESTSAPAPVSSGKQFVFESHLNATSFAVFKVKLDDLPEYANYSHYYKAKVEFVDETHQINSFYQHRETPPDPNPPKPEPTTEEPKTWFDIDFHYEKDQYSTKVAKPIEITLNSSVPIHNFNYLIVGRGNILESKKVVLEKAVNVYNFSVTPSFLMAPRAGLYVYFVDEHGELHYAEGSISVDVELRNQIEVTHDAQVKPGDSVSLTIKTEPHSFVGLIAIDQSVLLLAENNDFSSDEYKWQLGSYSTSTPWQGGYSRYPGEHTGVVTLTNADYFYNWTKPEYSLAHGPAHAFGAGLESLNKVGGASAVKVRKDFSETWLFLDIEDTKEEKFTLNSKIPDTITSWVLSAFALNPEKGLAIMKERTKIKTFQPFFISVRLPYAVKRGEVINVPSLVFNYLEKDLDVEITLENTDGEYEFLESSNEVIKEQKRTSTVRVPANSARGVSFLIRPKIIGNIMLKLTAISPIAGDAIHKTLKVIPEGITEFANRAFFINLNKENTFKSAFELDLPKNVVPDSQHIEFAVVGDLLGPLLNNLDNFLRLPFGCGEQVTSTIRLNYLILKYLNETKRLKSSVQRNVVRNMETGYQNVLSYRNEDGSFKAFNWVRRDDEKVNGSTWLTAYVIRTLNDISKHIKVDPKFITEGLDFLATRQAENGSFIEYSNFFYYTQHRHLEETAQIILTFLDNKDSLKKHQSVVDKGIKYLDENLEKTEDIYTKALLTYVLHKAEHATVSDHVVKLKALAKSDEDRMWWSRYEEEHKPGHWWRFAYSSDVEATAYVLLVLLDLDTENSQTVLPIIKWLASQRNNYGGFVSTQDTIIGLEAIIKFALKYDYQGGEMDVEFAPQGSSNKAQVLSVNEDNGLLYQTAELPPKTTVVDFSAKGKGSALVQVAYQYNIVEKEKKPSFNIKININKKTPNHKLEMEVCVEYSGEDKASNMAILEVPLPSGYAADTESFEKIEEVDHVKLVETKNMESLINIYFDSLHKDETKCLPIMAYKQHSVAMLKPVAITLYDYYDVTKKATEFYEVSSTLCDICEDDEECKKTCK